MQRITQTQERLAARPFLSRALAASTLALTLLGAGSSVALAQQPAGEEPVAIESMSADEIFTTIDAIIGARLEAGAITQDEAEAFFAELEGLDQPELAAVLSQLVAQEQAAGPEAGAEAGAEAVEIPEDIAAMSADAILEEMNGILGAQVEGGAMTQEEAEAYLGEIQAMSQPELASILAQTRANMAAAQAEGGGGMDPRAMALEAGYAACGLESGDRDGLIACIREHLATAQTKALDAAAEKTAQKQNKKFRRTFLALVFLTLLSPFLLLSPIVYRKQFPSPDQQRQLRQHSVTATKLGFLAMGMFSGTLLLLRLFQRITASLMNPQAAIVDATFQNLDKLTPDILDLIGAFMTSFITKAQEFANPDILVTFVEALQELAPNVEFFTNVAKRIQSVSEALSNFDGLFTLVAVLIFALAFKDMFLAVIKLPRTAMESGEEDAGKRVALMVVETCKAEAKVIGAFLGVILFVAIVSAIALASAVGPSTEGVIGMLVIAVVYASAVPDAAMTSLGVGIGSTGALLVLHVAMIIVPCALYMSRSQKILRGYFRWGIPLMEHKKFFITGTLIVIGMAFMPAIFMAIMEPVMESLTKSMTETAGPDITKFGDIVAKLGLIPLFAWIAVFFATLSPKWILWLVRYPVPKGPPSNDGKEEEAAAA